MNMLRETYTTVEDTKCNTCGNVDVCFQHYEWTEDGPRVWLTQCGFCDYDTDPRGAEWCEDLQNPEMWTEQMKAWSKANA